MKQNMILELKNVSKSFPGVKALDDVSFELMKGEVHALCGENGAGKSTLMKILYGVYHLDSGQIWIKGEKKDIESPLVAQANGLSIIFQEFNLVETLSVAENIYLGRLRVQKGKVGWKTIHANAKELLSHIGCDINTRLLISELSISQKQMVEIAKALSYNAEVIVMDEPSATLTEKEVENLYKIVAELKTKGISVIYISHKLEEVFDISDRVSVLRDGKLVCTDETKNLDKQKIIGHMVGRSFDQEFPSRGSCCGEEVLRAENIVRRGVLKNISINLNKGEVLGLAGLVGAGRTELVRAIFGADKFRSGTIMIHGRKVAIRKPIDAIKNKIALVTEDRKDQGLILKFPIKLNITITDLKRIVNFGLINKRKEVAFANEYAKKLSVKTPSINHKCINLSGGNQQKVVLAKWLFANADILILDEPTRGIDVGAKHEIYLIINELVRQGKSVILISSELPEVLAMSDRIVVLHEGEVKGEFDNRERQVVAEQIMLCAIG